MSSRSNGVMKVELIFLYSSWVIASLSCSTSTSRSLIDCTSALGQRQLGQQLRAPDQVLRGPAEQLVEGVLRGTQLETHGLTSSRKRWRVSLVVPTHAWYAMLPAPARPDGTRDQVTGRPGYTGYAVCEISEYRPGCGTAPRSGVRVWTMSGSSARTGTVHQVTATTLTSTTQRQSGARKPTVEDLLAAAVGAVPGGTDRPGQREMATAIADGVETGEHLLVQAGTGTGKSLAYLAPALLVDGPVVISTATLALQSQLVDHDLPRLADAVQPLLRRRPTFAVLKGRHHYLCLAKLDSGIEDEPAGRAVRRPAR